MNQVSITSQDYPTFLTQYTGKLTKLAISKAQKFE